jgi:hypothetical protein
LVGLPILVAGLRGARWLGTVHRRLAGRLLGIELDEPAPPAATTGFTGWIWAGLRDGTGWRAMLFLFLQPLFAFVTLYATLIVWVFGLMWPAWPSGSAPSTAGSTSRARRAARPSSPSISR